MYDTIILEYEGRFGRGRTVDDIVSWVETIPPLPEIASRALKLVDDPDSAPHEIAAALARDPALVSAILRAANSASLGRAETVTALEEAVIVVGLGSLKSLLLGMTLKRWNKSFGTVEKLVWEKSLGTATAACVLVKFLGKTNQDTARLCGLLHNLGQIIMLSHQHLRQDYPAVIDYIRQHGVDFATAEREVTGFSHPLIGAMVARKWQLPLPLCTTILRYAEPFEGIENLQDEQAALTQLSASLAMYAGLGCPSGHPLPCDTLHPLARALGFKEDDFARYQDVLAKQILDLHASETNTFG